MVAVALGARVELSTDPAEPRVRLDGEDVDAEIRGTEVTAAVSAVSALTAVRQHLVDEQRRIVAEVVEDGGGHRRRGTRHRHRRGSGRRPEGLPHRLRAGPRGPARRGEHRRRTGGSGGPSGTQADLARRDRLDSSRTASPLRPAEDAVEVDTSTLDIDGVLARLQELAEDRGLVTGLADAGVGHIRRMT